jgi:hypothetical protein
MYLGWFDDDRKKATHTKIEEAFERYVSKFGGPPTYCLCNVADAIDYEGLEVKAVQHVRPNHFWIGSGQPDELAA